MGKAEVRMGDVTDAILEGVLCEQCGVYIDSPAGGFPRKCDDCKPKRRRKVKRKSAKRTKL